MRPLQGGLWSFFVSSTSLFSSTSSRLAFRLYLSLYLAPLFVFFFSLFSLSKYLFFSTFPTYIPSLYFAPFFYAKISHSLYLSIHPSSFLSPLSVTLPCSISSSRIDSLSLSLASSKTKDLKNPYIRTTWKYVSPAVVVNWNGATVHEGTRRYIGMMMLIGRGKEYGNDRS